MMQTYLDQIQNDKNDLYLAESITAQANDLIFWGKISPSNANKTGPTPRAKANPVRMTNIGNEASRKSLKKSFSIL